MKTLTEHLAQYAAYHRHPLNILTHFLGIPMIVAAVTVLLSRPVIEVGFPLSPAIIATVLVLVFYYLLDLAFGLVMTALLGLALCLGHWSAAQSTEQWLVIGVGGFVVGWIFQFIGHYFEGRKPAFVDDLVGLVIGPLFVVAEALFFLGVRKELQSAVEMRAGPMRQW